MPGVPWPVDGEGPSDTPPEPERPVAANASFVQLFRNIAYQYAGFLVGLVASLVLTRVLLRHLGAGAYGLWVVLLAIVGYLGLLDVGVGTATVQRIAQLMAKDDLEGVADVIRTSSLFFSVSGLVSVLVTVGLAPFLASFLHLGHISPTVAGTTLIILGVMTMVTFLATGPTAVLFGAGRGDRLAHRRAQSRARSHVHDDEQRPSVRRPTRLSGRRGLLSASLAVRDRAPAGSTGWIAIRRKRSDCGPR